MHIERFKSACAVALVLEQDDKFLYIHRGAVRINPHCWSIIAGHIDAGESATTAIIRETYEEIGIIIKPENLSLIHTSFAYQPEYGEILSLYFHCTSWTNNIKNREPEKHTRLAWFEKSTMPSPLIEHVAQSMQCIQKNILFSEWGFSYKIGSSI